MAWLLTLPLVTPKIRGADEIEYFAYLRSLVFDRDLEFGNEYRHFYERDPQGLAGFKATFLDRREPHTGRHINFAPARIRAAVVARSTCSRTLGVLAGAGRWARRSPADGFSAPYVAAACYASWLYGGLGLLAHPRRAAAVRRLSTTRPRAGRRRRCCWASPLLYYMTIAPGFSHAASRLRGRRSWSG